VKFSSNIIAPAENHCKIYILVYEL